MSLLTSKGKHCKGNGVDWTKIQLIVPSHPPWSISNTLFVFQDVGLTTTSKNLVSLKIKLIEYVPQNDIFLYNRSKTRKHQNYWTFLCRRIPKQTNCRKALFLIILFEIVFSGTNNLLAISIIVHRSGLTLIHFPLIFGLIEKENCNMFYHNILLHRYLNMYKAKETE